MKSEVKSCVFWGVKLSDYEVTFNESKTQLLKTVKTVKHFKRKCSALFKKSKADTDFCWSPSGIQWDSLWKCKHLLDTRPCLCINSVAAVAEQSNQKHTSVCFGLALCHAAAASNTGLQMGDDITVIVSVVEFIWIYCDCTDIDKDMMMSLEYETHPSWLFDGNAYYEGSGSRTTTNYWQLQFSNINIWFVWLVALFPTGSPLPFSPRR